MQSALMKAIQLILSQDRELIDILGVTAEMSLQSSIIALLLGVPIGIWLGACRFPGRSVLLVGNRTLQGMPPVVCGLLRQLIDEIGKLPLCEESDAPACMINTELNSGNFLIDGENSHLVDWEKPLLSEPAQDLGHFLAPTTTFWKTDVILTPEQVKAFAEVYVAAVNGRMDCSTLAKRLPLYFTVTCLRGVTWCAMAYREYCQPGRELRNEDTFVKIEAYLEPAFLQNLLDNYVRKDFLA